MHVAPNPPQSISAAIIAPFVSQTSRSEPSQLNEAGLHANGMHSPASQ